MLNAPSLPPSLASQSVASPPLASAPLASSPLSGPLEPTVVVALTCLIAVGLITFALLRAWQDWIELKRRELESGSNSQNNTRREPDESGQMSVGAARIELSDMKERIKKLEAIASGVEL
ncbi:MAG: hypothetical protein WBA51_13210 [Erythrobacter sp.]